MLPSIHFIGPISLIINFLALVYLFRVIFELKGGLKKAMFFISYNWV